MSLKNIIKKVCVIWDSYEISVGMDVREGVLERLKKEYLKSRPAPLEEDNEDWIREWVIKGWIWNYCQCREENIRELYLEDGRVVRTFQDGETEEKRGEVTYLPLLKSIAKLFGESLTRYSNMFFGQLRDRTYIQGVTPDYFETSDEKPITRIRISFFVQFQHSLADLIENGTLSDEMARWLLRMNNIRANIIIMGGTGGGKTTLLNALFEYIPYYERVVVVEEDRELFRTNPQTIYLESKREVTLRDLTKAALRMQTNRILIDSVRNGEAFDICQAWNTGHDGSMITMHGLSVETIKDQLVDWSGNAVNGLPGRAAREMVEEVLEVAVHIARVKSGDRVVLGVYMWDKQTASWVPVWRWNSETWEKKNSGLVSSLQEKENEWKKWKQRQRVVYEPRKHDFRKYNVSPENSWARFENWLIQNVPSYIEKLNPPASEDEIMWAEKEMGVVLPEDVKSFYRVHNGETKGMFGGREILSIHYMVEEWRLWKQLIDEGELDGVYSRPEKGIKRDWWNLKWIPLASDGGGNFYCLDLDPAEGGNVGQVIAVWHDEEERTAIASCFADWFAGIVEKLETKVYSMDETEGNNAFGNME